MLTRRDFLSSNLLPVAAGLAVPAVFAKGVYAAAADRSQNDRVLVILQLGGGNDGLNTVVPYNDGIYYQNRPKIGIKAPAVLKLDNSLGLNPSLKGIKGMWDQGKVAIVQGVGYPNPSYSHFQSIRIWEFADPAMANVEGWLGEYLAKNFDPRGHPLAGCALGQATVPAELRGPISSVTVIQSAQGFQVQGGAPRTDAAQALYAQAPPPYGVLFDTAMSTAQAAMQALGRAQSKYQQPMGFDQKPKLVYSAKNNLAQSLELASELISTDAGVKVVHVTLGGFDTHTIEEKRHDDLLAAVDSAVSAFFTDLAARGHADRVVMMTWSEFGRRVRENASQGTDHGAAAPMFIIGNPVKGGLYGEAPSLQNLDNGNLRYTTDFRSVYRTILEDYLGADASAVLKAQVPSLRFLH
jgi:uncharacterized protein (DUF1501 family)